MIEDEEEKAMKELAQAIPYGGIEAIDAMLEDMAKEWDFPFDGLSPEELEMEREHAKWRIKKAQEEHAEKIKKKLQKKWEE